MKIFGIYTKGSRHAVIEEGKTVCGLAVEVRKKKLPHSGRTNVTCKKCLKGIPEGYY